MKLITRFRKYVAVATVLKQTGEKQEILVSPQMILWLDRLLRGTESDEEFEKVLGEEETP